MGKEEYKMEEIREAELVTSQDGWDIDEIAFFDKETITVADLRESAALKLAYGRYISATNWIRWCLL
jgi:hypothetical protein